MATRFDAKPGFLESVRLKKKKNRRCRNIYMAYIYRSEELEKNLSYSMFWPESLIWAASRVAAKAAQYPSWWISTGILSRNGFQSWDTTVPALEEAIVTVKRWSRISPVGGKYVLYQAIFSQMPFFQSSCRD